MVKGGRGQLRRMQRKPGRSSLCFRLARWVSLDRDRQEVDRQVQDRGGRDIAMGVVMIDPGNLVT